MSGTVRVTREALLPAPAERVWQVVTSLEDTAWRSDLREVNDLGEGRFVEVTKEGVSTTFATVVWEPGRRWAFTLENPSLTGRWEGVFQPREGGTWVRFTEEVTPRRWYLRPFVKGYLKRQQARYLADLELALG